jgi:hypothetical protein
MALHRQVFSYCRPIFSAHKSFFLPLKFEFFWVWCGNPPLPSAHSPLIVLFFPLSSPFCCNPPLMACFPTFPQYPVSTLPVLEFFFPLLAYFSLFTVGFWPVSSYMIFCVLTLLYSSNDNLSLLYLSVSALMFFSALKLCYGQYIIFFVCSDKL